MNRCGFGPAVPHNSPPRRWIGSGRLLATVASIVACHCLTALADDGATNAAAGSLADLTVEQLMNESVTSVAKRETRFDQSATAISVITQDDIRRLGITTIPDALRLVPGLEVAQINSHEWAVSARGFNNQFANDLLVLIDGRSVYGTGFGGVVWGVQDVPMQDVERIEVIRGPGASLWGANAVNGVINIITKSAKDTQGTLISVSGGTFDQPLTTVRYGGQFGTNLFYRGYVTYDNRDGMVVGGGQDAPDSSRTLQGGFRLDWEPMEQNKLTLQGDLYHDRFVENQDMPVFPALAPPYMQNFNEANYDTGGNILGRWTHDFSDDSSLIVQAYYDNFKQEQVGAREYTDTYDLDAQHHFALGSRNQITWGLGYRYVEDDFHSSEFVAWNPADTSDRLFSSFAQDEITLWPDRLKLTVGSKFEHDDYAGFDIEPSARLAWTPTDRQTVWAAVSRAVRTPSWIDLHSTSHPAVIPPAPPGSPFPVVVANVGNPGLESEDLTAYELGYRVEVARRVSLDVAGYYNDYNRLIAYTSITTNFVFAPAPYALVTATDENAGDATTYGLEASAHWDITGRWHLTANYSWIAERFAFTSSYLQSAPSQQAQLISFLDLPCHLELNGSLSYVDQITAPIITGQAGIPDYVRLDLGVVWHATKNLELGVWGQNLIDNRHAEFYSYKTPLITEIPRGVFASVTLRF